MRTAIPRYLMLLATVFTFGYGHAAEPLRMYAKSKKTTLERTLERALTNNLSYPLLTRENMNGEVYVSFVIDKEGRIQVIDSRSANQSLKDHVLRKLARIDIGDNPMGSWKTTHMVFSFHPEKS